MMGPKILIQRVLIVVLNSNKLSLERKRKGNITNYVYQFMFIWYYFDGEF